MSLVVRIQRLMKRRLVKSSWMAVLIASLLAPFLPIAGPSKAQAASLESQSLGFKLTEWVLDESRGYIYAVSEEGNKLLFIRMSDLQVETSIDIGSKPSDIDLFNGKLYVPLSGATQIKIVDIASKTVERTLATTDRPYLTAVTDNKVFYVGGNYRNSVFEYNLSTNGIREVKTAASSEPDIIIDQSGQKLFVGARGSSGSNLYAYSVSDHRLLSQTTYDEGYGFSYPNRKLLLDDAGIYFAGYLLDPANLAVIQGNYRARAYFSNGKYVLTGSDYTPGAVMDRKTFTEVTKLPYASSLMAMDSSNQIYMFKSGTTTIEKLQLPLTPAALTASKVTGGVRFNYGLSDWTVSENGEYIYAIFKDANRLVTLRSSDLSVVGDMFIGSDPVDISGYEGKLYVALSGSTKIGVVDTVYGTSVPSSVYQITVDTNPFQIEAGNKLYYAYNDQWEEVRVYDAVYGGSGQKLKPDNQTLSVYVPKLKLDQTNNMLYVGGANSLTQIRTTDNKIISKRDRGAYSSQILKDGPFLYFGKERLDANVISYVYGEYGAPVVYANGPYVFTQSAVYNRDTFNKQFDLSYTIDQALILKNGNVLTYDPSTSTVYRYNSMSELQQDTPANRPPMHLPVGVSFYDTDDNLGTIGGSLRWSAPSSEEFITEYTVYFLDANKQKIGASIYTLPKTAGYSYSVDIPKGTKLPQGAKYFGVYAKNSVGEGATPGVADIWDNTGTAFYASPLEPRLVDTDPQRGALALKLSWYVYESSDKFGYDLFFADSNKKPMGDRFGKVAYEDGVASDTSNVQRKFSFDIKGSVPDQAAYVAIKAVNSKGQSAMNFTYLRIYDNILSEQVPLDSGVEGRPSSIPAAVSFFDENQAKGKLSGILSWHEFSAANDVTDYIAYFLDGEGKKLKPIMQTKRSDSRERYEVSLPEIAIPSGAKRIAVYSKNEKGESEAGASIPIWDRPYATPSQTMFIDTNPSRGKIEGKVTWQPSADESDISGYHLFFGNRMFQWDVQPFATVTKGEDQYTVNVAPELIKADTAYVMVVPVNEKGEPAPNKEIVHISDNVSSEKIDWLKLVDSVSPIQPSPFLDIDGEAGQIGGTLSFFVKNDDPEMIYQTFFANQTGEKLQLLSEIKGRVGSFGGMGSEFQISIPPHTKLPPGATQIGIVTRGRGIEAKPVFIPVQDRIRTAPLREDQIIVTNNKDGNDSIQVNGLQEGDNIRIYRTPTVPYSMASAVVEKDKQSVAFNVNQLGAGSGSIYVSIQRGDTVESLRTAKSYNAENNNSQTPVNSGGGFVGGGGGGAPSSPSNDKVSKTTIDDKKAAELLKGLNKESTQLVVEIPGKADAVQAEFTRDSFKALAGGLGNAKLVIKSEGASLELPKSVIEQLVAELSAANEKGSVIVSFTKADQALEKAVVDVLAQTGASVVSKLVDFKIEVITAEGKIKEINALPTYAARTLEIGDVSAEMSASQLAGLVIDKNSGQYYPIPAIFTNRDGKWQGTLYRKGNSLYTIVRQSKTFNDIAPEHYAKGAIETLASKFIVSGYPDGSFASVRPVTRAELASMLTKALGLIPDQASQAQFSDVKASDWYSIPIASAAASGLIAGYEDGTFRPDTPVTRQELVVMLQRAVIYAGLADSSSGVNNAKSAQSYRDQDQIAEWAKDAVFLSNQLGIVQGFEDSSFRPQAQADRGQVSIMLYRMMKAVNFIN
ncbi:S-layer homology domain-containing protein [Paenibacillus tyrfis]|uniref:SLH domain-containing protein n=1 Tax=Paenibacillus tyrfis TaxID=1501230 RepID=A0A081P077_9BACL|nr:S-layer homology domain-containing protein [Paenibacillus tyrfis]KEQ24100.1 hypothetical protein ET33_10355 [Paenibacillus tyrfis]